MLVLPSQPKPLPILGALHNSPALGTAVEVRSLCVFRVIKGSFQKGQKDGVMVISLTHKAPDPPGSMGFLTSEPGPVAAEVSS